MTVIEAKKLAKRWIMREAVLIDGYVGAYFIGSIVRAVPKDNLPIFSDIDIAVVIEGEHQEKLGKFDYEGILLEVIYISLSTLLDTEKLLCTYELAGSIYGNAPVHDPEGLLNTAFKVINDKFTQRQYLNARCCAVYDKLKKGAKVSLGCPFYDNISSCLFSAGIITHAVLVAAFENPTVRLRYVRALDILKGLKMVDFYEEIIKVTGFDNLTQGTMNRHLVSLEKVFDEAVKYSGNLFFFSSDISLRSKSIAIDGSRELIRGGYHREAAFWVGATYARCHKILVTAGKENISKKHMFSFEDFAGEIGIDRFEKMLLRIENILSFLPALELEIGKIIEKADV